MTFHKTREEETVSVIKYFLGVIKQFTAGKIKRKLMFKAKGYENINGIE